MKDSTRTMWERERPAKIYSRRDYLEFCLKRLEDDEEHVLADEIVKGFTFEELIGVILLAIDDYDAEH